MKEFTRVLKQESNKDFRALHAHNNSKIRQRTPEQNEQAHHDKVTFYLKKWNAFLEKAETESQKNICKNMLEIIEKTPKYY